MIKKIQSHAQKAHKKASKRFKKAHKRAKKHYKKHEHHIHLGGVSCLALIMLAISSPFSDHSYARHPEMQMYPNNRPENNESIQGRHYAAPQQRFSLTPEVDCIAKEIVRENDWVGVHPGGKHIMNQYRQTQKTDSSYCPEGYMAVEAGRHGSAFDVPVSFCGNGIVEDNEECDGSIDCMNCLSVQRTWELMDIMAHAGRPVSSAPIYKPHKEMLLDATMQLLEQAENVEGTKLYLAHTLRKDLMNAKNNPYKNLHKVAIQEYLFYVVSKYGVTPQRKAKTVAQTPTNQYPEMKKTEQNNKTKGITIDLDAFADFPNQIEITIPNKDYQGQYEKEEGIVTLQITNQEPYDTRLEVSMLKEGNISHKNYINKYEKDILSNIEQVYLSNKTIHTYKQAGIVEFNIIERIDKNVRFKMYDNTGDGQKVLNIINKITTNVVLPHMAENTGGSVVKQEKEATRRGDEMSVVNIREYADFLADIRVHIPDEPYRGKFIEQDDTLLLELSNKRKYDTKMRISKTNDYGANMKDAIMFREGGGVIGDIGEITYSDKEVYTYRKGESAISERSEKGITFRVFDDSGTFTNTLDRINRIKTEVILPHMAENTGEAVNKETIRNVGYALTAILPENKKSVWYNPNTLMIEKIQNTDFYKYKLLFEKKSNEISMEEIENRINQEYSISEAKPIVGQEKVGKHVVYYYPSSVGGYIYKRNQNGFNITLFESDRNDLIPFNKETFELISQLEVEEN